jgi:hypothetical protein
MHRHNDLGLRRDAVLDVRGSMLKDSSISAKTGSAPA